MKLEEVDFAELR